MIGVDLGAADAAAADADFYLVGLFNLGFGHIGAEFCGADARKISGSHIVPPPLLTAQQAGQEGRYGLDIGHKQQGQDRSDNQGHDSPAYLL